MVEAEAPGLEGGTFPVKGKAPERRDEAQRLL